MLESGLLPGIRFTKAFIRGDSAMKKTKMTLVVWTILTTAALAQMEMPKPAPELKKLEALAGNWSLDGDMKPGPVGPGGKMTETQKCDWMEGAFFLVCQINFKSSMGDGTGVSVLGYSSDDKAYTYREFNSWGEFEDSRGSLDGDTWTWTSDEKMGGTTMKGRFSMKMTSATSYNFTFEMSQDGTKWNVVMDGKATKGK
jgi:hypothetical protein